MTAVPIGRGPGIHSWIHTNFLTGLKSLLLIKKRVIGGVLLAMYRQDDGTFYLEAESNEFRVWRLTCDEDIANEYYVRFWFWSWLVEAIPSRTFLRLATYLMRK